MNTPRIFYLSTSHVSVFTKCKTKRGIGILKYLNSFGHSNISLRVDNDILMKMNMASKSDLDEKNGNVYIF